MLLPEAVSFWTEHSDRSGVDGWLATLGVDQSLRSFVGRWSNLGAADLYVRTSLRVTENLQKLAADHAKDSYSGGADHFGEEHLLDQLRAYLRYQNVAEPAIEAQVRRLTVAILKIERSTRTKTTQSRTSCPLKTASQPRWATWTLRCRWLAGRSSSWRKP